MPNAWKKEIGLYFAQMKPIYFTVLIAFVLATLPTASTAESTLRISCAGEDTGAEVYINGTYKGICPVDVKVPEGMAMLRVQKAVDAKHERLFVLNVLMSDEVVKKVVAKLGKAQLTAAEKARTEEEKAKAKAEADARAEEKAKAKAAVKAKAEEQAKLKAEEKARIAEEKARAQAEAKVKAEERARLKAEKKAQLAEKKALARAAAKARAQEQARLEAAKKARLAKEKARAEAKAKAAEKAKAAAEAKANELAQLKAKEDAMTDEEKAKAAEEKAKAKAIAKAQAIAAKKARLKAEENKLLAEINCPECPEMVIIPEGRFQMGSPASEKGRNDNEGPVHEVKIGKFAMGKHEVTVGEFREFVKATGYKTDAEKNTGNMQGCHAWDKSARKSGWRAGSYWNNPGFIQDDLHPVVCVSWNDTQAYIEWISKKTGKPYRLPSEAEWEYAARAGTTTARYWGNATGKACKYANVADQTKFQGSWELKHECSDGYWFTAPVGSFKPNAFGVYDMLGNVWEWVADNWHDNYSDAPTNGSVWPGGDSTKHAVRGSSWNNSPHAVRAAKHNGYDTASRYIYNGFRLACALPH